jgi:hypothetical protein
MKSGLTFIVLLCLSSTLVFGQLEKGNLFIQGSSSLGFYAEKYTYIAGGTSTESSKSTHFGFKPKAGYFIIDNLPVGLAINFNTNSNKNISNSDKSSSTNLSFGPFARYYFLKLDKLCPMAEISVNLGSDISKSTYSGYKSDKKYGVFEFNLGVGASYFVTDHIAFDVLLSYYADKYKLKSQSSTSPAKSTQSSGISTDKYTGVDFSIGVVVTIP